jgi:hypothetical protein
LLPIVVVANHCCSQCHHSYVRTHPPAPQ